MISGTRRTRQPETEGSAIKTRKASCNCGQLTVTYQRPRPGAEILVPLQLLPEADGQRVRHTSAIPKGAGDDRRQIDGVEVSHRGREAGHVSQLRQHGGHVSFLPRVRFDRLLRACRRTGLIGVKVGAFTDPTFPPPMISGFEEYRFPWAMNVAALPMPGGITTSGGLTLRDPRN